MKTLCFIALTFFALVLPKTPFSEVVSKNNEEVKKLAAPILENILDGFKTDNYRKYSNDFSESLKSQISEETFSEAGEQIKKMLGDYKSSEYLGFLNRDGMTLVLWKGRFEKMESDVLIKLTLSKNGRKNEVEGLYFQ